MSKIIRTKTRAEGGITEEEKIKLAQHTEKWIANAYQTGRTDKVALTQAIKNLYKVSGLKEPRVVIVPSPFVGRLASGIAAAVWYLRKNGKTSATYAATRAATADATYAATDDATADATRAATRAATYAATYAATDDATYDATRDATDDATENTKKWLLDFVKKITPESVTFTLGCISLSWKFYQGGNMWSSYDSFLSAGRDILGLELPIYEKYEAWERCAKLGGFRYMHEEFCIVSDFPDFIHVDEQKRPHCDFGPSHRWADGFEIYHLDGVRFEKEVFYKIISQKMTFKEIMSIEISDQRTIALKYNPQAILNEGANLVHADDRNNELYCIEGKEINKEWEYPKIYFLKMKCPTGRIFIEGVDPEEAEKNPNATAMQAQLCGLTLSQYMDMPISNES